MKSPAARRLRTGNPAFSDHQTILPSTIGELSGHTFQVKPETGVTEIVTELENDPELPGALIIENHRCLGVVSRQKCFEHLGRPFGVEVFLARSIITLMEAIEQDPLLLPGSTRIDRAVEAALSRPPEHRYEPIVVQRLDQGFQLLDVHVLLLAQSRLLANANRLVKQQIDISRALSSSRPPEDVLALILEHLKTAVVYHRGGVVLQVGSQLKFAAHSGFPHDMPDHKLNNPVAGCDLYQHLVKTRAPLLIPEVSSQPHWQYFKQFSTARTALAVPLVQANVVIGMLLLMRVFANMPYTEDELEIAETIAAQAALALQSAQVSAEKRTVTARLKNLDKFRAPAWEKLNRDLEEVLTALSHVAHNMLEVPVDAVEPAQRRQFMELQAAGQRLRTLLHQAALARRGQVGPEPEAPSPHWST